MPVTVAFSVQRLSASTSRKVRALPAHASPARAREGAGGRLRAVKRVPPGGNLTVKSSAAEGPDIGDDGVVVRIDPLRTARMK